MRLECPLPGGSFEGFGYLREIGDSLFPWTILTE